MPGGVWMSTCAAIPMPEWRMCSSIERIAVQQTGMSAREVIQVSRRELHGEQDQLQSEERMSPGDAIPVP